MNGSDASGGAPLSSKDAMGRHILRERAKALAAEPKEGPLLAAGEVIDVLQFMLGGARYGVASRFVREVEALGDLTHIPCTPEIILGVVGVRGQIVAVTDPVVFFGLECGHGIAPATLVVLSNGAMTTALAVDAVLGVRAVALADLQRDVSGMPSGLAGYIVGMTGEPMLLLDAGRILADKRLVVHEDVD
ncbi:MAG: chemotaxis protein CheW [Desulfovibrionaceae bacterium]